jgi:hypothetical protein
MDHLCSCGLQLPSQGAWQQCTVAGDVAHDGRTGHQAKEGKPEVRIDGRQAQDDVADQKPGRDVI